MVTADSLFNGQSNSLATALATTATESPLARQARRQLAAGRLEEAYMSCHQVLSNRPDDEETLITLANVLHQLGELDTGLQHTQHALSIAPHRIELYTVLTELAVSNRQPEIALAVLRRAQTSLHRAELWWLEALVHKSQGQRELALTHLNQALALDSSLPQARFELGALLFEQGNLEAACQCYEQLSQDHPQHVESLLNLGICRASLGQPEQARIVLEQALELEPTRAGIWLALGNLAQQRGDFVTAISSYEQAQVLAPADPELSYHYGLALYKHGQMREALDAFTEADRLNPDSPKPSLAIAAILMETRQFEAAIHQLEGLRERFPHSTEVMGALAQALDECGRSAESRYHYQRLLIAEPSRWEWRLAFGRSIPVIPQRVEDIPVARERLLTTLHGLMQQDIHINLDSPTTLPDLHPPFYLPYQPQDERPVRQAYARWMDKVLTPYNELRYQPPTVNTGETFRLGWLVTRHHEGIFSRLMTGLFKRLDRERFTPVLIAPTDSHDFLRDQFALQDGDELISLPLSVPEAARQIKALSLDALHFYEVGSDTQNYLLPFFRLAPMQFTSWGYPVTTGIPTMDTFLSCEAFETGEAAGHYSEQLVTLPGVPGVFPRPQASQPLPFLRDRFGFGVEQHIYACPQNLFKLHPDFDRVIGEILRRDPKGILVLLHGLNPYWRQALLARFERTLYDVLPQIRFVPRQSPQAYIDLLAASDVVLDPFYYGGGSSSLEALGVGTPVVTWPGVYQRSRHTAGFYKLMGLDGLVVNSAEGYYQKALALGTQPELRRDWQDKIRTHNHGLFNDECFAQAYQIWLLERQGA